MERYTIELAVYTIDIERACNPAKFANPNEKNSINEFLCQTVGKSSQWKTAITNLAAVFTIENPSKCR